VERVITAERPELVELFAGVPPRAFRQLVAQVAGRGGRQVVDGRQWSLPLADRVLLVATYYRTNLTMRQLAPLFGITPAAVHRIIDRIGPYLALAPARRRYGPGTVLIVDGTLVPTRDRAIAASSKNYRHSANMQVMIDANTRLVIAVGRPLPGNRNDCRAWTESGIDTAAGTAHVMADGGYHGPNCAGVIIPYRKPRDGSALPAWQDDLNTVHRRVRARVEHTFAAMKNYKILRDCRRRGDGVYWATTGIAHLRNLAVTS
jgi:Transposase DDE domain/Helix-turn-helix of DDE superfamily endonuclease